MTALGGWERRIGVRRDVTDASVGWWPAPDEFPVEVPPGAATGDIIQMSVSGALVHAPVTPGLDVGHPVGMEHDGVVGTAVVRRIEATADPGRRAYSVEFTSNDPALANSLYTLLDRAELAELRAAWIAGEQI